MEEIAKAKIMAEDLDAQTFWARLREFATTATAGISYMSINRIEAKMVLELKDGEEIEGEVIGEDDGEERRGSTGELSSGS
jgi:hypothetical protein